MKYCPRCSTARDEGAAFCRRCGLDLEAAEAGRGEVVHHPGYRPPRMAPYEPRRPQYEPPPGEIEPPPVYVAAPVPEQALQSHYRHVQYQAPQLDVRLVDDRQNMARLSARALDVRCGGTAGGCLGMMAGFWGGALVGGALGLGLLSLVPVTAGMLVGTFLGTRVALGIMGR